MDKTILKNFAIESRKDLMDKIDRKIKLFYVNEEFKKDNRGDVIVLSNDKHTLTLTKDEDSNRDKLLKRIVELGYDQVVEEAAYTWFNRIIAIRYMEIHDFLPLSEDNQSLGINVLSSADNNPIPEILKFSNLTRKEMKIDFDSNYYSNLSKEDDKFKYVLLLICKKLARVIPQVFGGITDYIDLLIPDNMLNDNGFITKLLKEITIEDFKQVEIIGWLYQYYNQTEKDKTMAKKGIYKKNEIPYVTQLFTPDWIVKYMVDNSLGRYYIEHSKDENIKDNLLYLVSDNIKESKENIDITGIKFIDPCSGSGHILVYAFEVFYQMYLDCGYSKNDIAENILKNNLYGLDIDDRAGQLSVLSVILKAREFDKNIFNKNIIKDLNICSIQESNNENLSFFDEKLIKKNNLDYLIESFKNAKELGSLLKIEKKDYSNICEDFGKDIIGLSLIESLKPLIKQANILSEKYDIIVTNPPYMNNSVMSNSLKKYLADNYKNSKIDLCTAFMEVNLLKESGYYGIINQHSWMFLSSFEKLRESFINSKHINTMVHLGTRAFEEIGGEVVQTTAFVFTNKKINEETLFYRLVDLGNANLKETEFLNNKEKYRYVFNQENFVNISGYEFIYWFTDNYINIFKTAERLGDLATPKQGLATGENNRFVRQWFEVSLSNSLLNSNSESESRNSDVTWFPYNKGGEFRKWYGNNDCVVNWKNDGIEIKNFKDENGNLRSRPQNLEYYFKESITWSKISGGSIAFRYKPCGHIFDVAGTSIFTEHKKLMYLLGLNNSKVIMSILKATSPTLNFEVGQIASTPIIFSEKDEDTIIELVNQNIQLSKEDWDSFETSWDFKIHPLIKYRTGESSEYKIKDSFELWKDTTDKRFEHLKNNEEKLNEIFINIYGLNNELTPTLEEKDITIRKADCERDVKSLLSYSVGCMFGRYSLDEEGIVSSGNDFDITKYKSFKPDEDNIIPISDNDSIYYNDDIVGRFIEFIKTVFGKKYLNENMNFIAESLGKRGTESNEDCIRRYFINDFYTDHIKTYQKRPIYWLFDSGKKNGFKCLVYLHRYNEQIVSKLRTKYLHNTLSIYQRTVEEIDYNLNNDELSTIDKRELQNKKSDLNAKITECNEYEEKVGNVANKMIKLDLDDGVMINYSKFIDDNGKSILAKIK